MKRQMFIDPASISTGWSVWEKQELQMSATVAVNPQAQAFDRLGQLFHAYHQAMTSLIELGLQPGEVYFECVPPRCAWEVYWSIGAIGAALSPYATVNVNTLLLPSRWQKAVGWVSKEMRRLDLEDVGPGRGLTANSPLLEYLPAVKSQDELAAIGMGLYYVWL